MIQIRAKEASSAALLAWCEEVVAAAGRYDAAVIVNDRADVAAMAGAAGVHVGQEDLSVRAVRAILGRPGARGASSCGAVVGISTHTLAQVRQALHEPVDYIALGPVFATATKATGYDAVGLEGVAEVAALAGAIPVVAIGGITLDTAPRVLAAGAASVAVIGDLLQGGDPLIRVRQFLHALP